MISDSQFERAIDTLNARMRSAVEGIAGLATQMVILGLLVAEQTREGAAR